MDGASRANTCLTVSLAEAGGSKRQSAPKGGELRYLPKRDIPKMRKAHLNPFLKKTVDPN